MSIDFNNPEEVQREIEKRLINGADVLEEARKIVNTDYYKNILESRDLFDGLLAIGKGDQAIGAALTPIVSSPVTMSMLVALVLVTYNRERAKALLGQMD